MPPRPRRLTTRYRAIVVLERSARVSCIAAALSYCAGCARADPADLILHNARIYTMNGERPTADAIAVRGDRIVHVGDDDAVLHLRGEATRVIDADGATIVPGLQDAHGHFTGLGERLQILDLRGTTSYDEVVARVRD